MVSNDALIETLTVYESLGRNATATADHFNRPRSTVQSQIKRAVRLNLSPSGTPAPFLGDIPPGYTLGKVTSLVGPNGVMMEWQHKHPEADEMTSLFDALAETLTKAVTPVTGLPTAPPAVAADLATVYPLPDVHLGLYAWWREAGESYDLSIAEEAIKSTFSELVVGAPASDTAILLYLGDNFHADDNNARTPRSGNPLDTDGRHDKVLAKACEIIMWQVEILLQKHARVVIRILRGNHDPYASRALSLGMWLRYRDATRVFVDRDPAPFFFFQWGKTMLAASHGHEAKPEAMPGVMASYQPKMWGATEYRYAYLGHFHHRRKGPAVQEHHGAIWEIFQAFTAKDEWNTSMGHHAGRSLTAITIDKNKGEIYRQYANIRG